MSNFIQRIAQDLIHKNYAFANTSILIPGKRPALQFKKAFLDLGYSGILPQFLSLQEFIQEQADLFTIPNYKVQLIAYKLYQNIRPKGDTLEEFLNWFPTLLKDFDDIDAQLCDAQSLFNYLVANERIEQWGKTKMVQEQQLFWEMAKDLYPLLQKELLSQGYAYSGMASRLAVKKLLNKALKRDNKYVICGFNALTKAEEEIFKFLQQKNVADFYWHTDQYYLKDNWQEAGHFLRLNAKWTDIDNFLDSDFEKSKSIHKIAANGKLAQAQTVKDILAKQTEAELNNCAVVLGDENILPLVLDSLPSNISELNITMGLRIANYPQIIAWLHIFEKLLNPDKENDYVPSFWFESKATYHQFLDTLIRFDQKNVSDLVTHCHNYVERFYATKEQALSTLNLNMVLKILSVFSDFKVLLSQIGMSVDLSSFRKIFQQLIATETVDFIGEPLKGLQLSGMLETRLLQFDTLILTSVNEGTLPLGKRENSFISYSIRKQYGLNTYSENDAVYAYHFYRLLQSAKNIHLIYNTSESGMGSAEQSRFITQLEYESPHDIQHSVVEIKSSLKEPKKEILRDPKLTLALEKWMESGVSASALNTYIKDPFTFITEKILRIQFSNDFKYHSFLGNIVHNTLENLYKEHCNEVMSEPIILKLQKTYKQELERVYNQELALHEKEETQFKLLKSVAEQFIANQLDSDKDLARNTNWEILALEEDIRDVELEVDDKKAKFRGFIDRVDKINGEIRLLDYKTGSASLNKNYPSEDLETAIHKKSGKECLQLLVYAFMYLHKYKLERVSCSLSLLKSKEVINLTINGETSIPHDIVNDFGILLADLVKEIVYEKENFEHIETYNFS